MVFSLVLAGLTVTANVNPSLEMPGLAWEVRFNHLFANIKYDFFSTGCGDCGEDLPAEHHLRGHPGCNYAGWKLVLLQDLEAVLGNKSQQCLNAPRGPK